MILKTITTNKLTKKNILDICRLKNSFWNFGLQSNIQWFVNNVKKLDHHFCLSVNKKLCGYVLLRSRTCFIGGIKKKYLYFDTLVVRKSYRNKKLSKTLLDNCNKFIKKKRKIAFLLCDKRLVKFYTKNKWKTINKKKYKVVDHKTKKEGMAFNLQNIKNNIKFHLYK